MAAVNTPAHAASGGSGADSKPNEVAGNGGRVGYAFPLTPVATPQEHRKRLQGGGGGGGEAWEAAFNQWVVLEGETLREARKTEQLAFLKLEAIKVGGWSHLQSLNRRCYSWVGLRVVLDLTLLALLLVLALHLLLSDGWRLKANPGLFISADP